MSSDSPISPAVESGKIRTCPKCGCRWNADVEQCPVCPADAPQPDPSKMMDAREAPLDEFVFRLVKMYVENQEFDKDYVRQQFREYASQFIEQRDAALRGFKAADNNAEHFEREWYLVKDELEQLRRELSEEGVDEHISKSGASESRMLVNHRADVAERDREALRNALREIRENWAQITWRGVGNDLTASADRCEIQAIEAALEVKG